MAEVESKYKMEGLLQELSAMEESNHKQTEENKKFRLLLGGAAGILLLMLISYFLIRWKNK
jgi:hypothetical protein